ncbi:hypothetical protein D3C84_635540 [compost metagenome]
MFVGLQAVLTQATGDTLQGAAVQRQNPASRAGQIDQRRHLPADPGDARHLRQAFTVEAQRDVVGQLRNVGATGAGVDQGQGSAGHEDSPVIGPSGLVIDQCLGRQNADVAALHGNQAALHQTMKDA